MKHALLYIGLVVSLLSLSTLTATAESDSGGAFMAYHASVNPIIDGILSAGEWSDARPYYYHSNQSYNIREDGNLSMATCIKYDARWVYILFIINDDDDNGMDFIAISMNTNATNYPSYFHDIFIISRNGSASVGVEARPGIWPYELISDGSIRTSSTYRNSTYVFEVAMDFTTYFHGTYPQSFQIEYCDVDAGVLSWERYITFPASGISFSPDHYSGDETIYGIMSEVYDYPIESEKPPYFIILPMSITVLVSAGILVAIFRRIRRKN